MTLTMKMAAGLGGLALAALAGSGIASAAPGDAVILNSTCTYPQVIAAANAQDPAATAALQNDPAANGFLQGLVASPPPDRPSVSRRSTSFGASRRRLSSTG